MGRWRRRKCARMTDSPGKEPTVASYCRWTSYVAVIAFATLAGGLPAFGEEPAPATFLPDAELTDLCFVDPDHGWAVGDRGAIWRTRDGGKAWKLQPCPVNCRLEAVSFIDAQNGWTVGSRIQPYTHQRSAVVLRTRDGGARWTELRSDTLPGLRVVKFFDARNGWAAGDGSALYPAGVFRTSDGGQSWTPLSKGGGSGWVAGDFRDARSGALAGIAGEQGLAVGVEIRPTRTGDLGARYLRKLKLGPATTGWLVGDGGLVLATRDSGFSWTEPTTPFPTAWSQQFDFRALAVLGSHCWIAGAPGTAVFHSPDGGQTWQRDATGQTAPLRALHFLDENRGWAVGAWGTILATRDGGKTWRPQHQGGTRAGLLAIVGSAERTPWEALAHLGGNEGYLSAVEVLGRSDALSDSSAARSARFRLHEGVVAAGGGVADTAWRFPAPDPALAHSTESLLDFWNRSTDGKAAELAEEHLVRRIRQWRPEVILTEDVSPRGDDPLGRLTSQLVLTAAAKAGDAAVYPQQLTDGLLAPWSPRKVISSSTGERGGEFQLAPSQWATRLGCPLAEQAENGRALLAGELTVPPPVLRFSLLVDRLPQGMGARDFFSGLALAPGGEARRQLADPPATALGDVARIAQRRHNAQQLIQRVGAEASGGQAWLGQAEELTKDLGGRAAGEILFQLGRRYHQAGQSELAADAFERLLTRSPEHPLADRAAVWLVQYFASEEVAWRHRKASNYDVRLTTLAAEPTTSDADQPAGRVKLAADAVGQKPQGQAIGFGGSAAPELAPSQRASRAIEWAKRLEKADSLVYSSPAVRFPLLAALGKPGQARSGDNLLSSVLGSRDPAWMACAQAEQWIASKQGIPPKKVISCSPAAVRPQLDGRLDDALWRGAKPVALTNPAGNDAEWPAVAALAYDAEFFYVALSCRKIAGVSYPADASTRTYDSPLEKQDHVRILLDLDRDYASYYSLGVDQHGFTADDCFGDATWNPTWYVAAGGDSEWWTAEIAIPWSELRMTPPRARDIWAIGLQRSAPGGRFQAASQPAAATIRPEGFALLAFE